MIMELLHLTIGFLFLFLFLFLFSSTLEYRWTYADPSWARIAALVPVVVSCAEAGDEVANRILYDSVEELASSVKAVVQRLGLCGEGVEYISNMRAMGYLS